MLTNSRYGIKNGVGKIYFMQKLEENYENLSESKTEIIHKFVENVYDDFPNQMKILKIYQSLHFVDGLESIRKLKQIR